MAEKDQTIVVVGGGQAGLAMGHHLRRAGASFVILDAGERTGDPWRNRWDSLRLFSLARYTNLPGLDIHTSSYPTRDEIADYLETYAAEFDLPIRHRTSVHRLSREDGRFRIETDTGVLTADQVVVATGGHPRQRHPDFAGELDPSIRQLDSTAYRRPDQLTGDVLVIGAGTSGSDIAVDLARAGHETVLAGPHPGQIPLDLDSFVVRTLMPVIMFSFRHLFTTSTPFGWSLRRRISRHGTPLIRHRRRDIAAAGVRRVQRITGTVDGWPQTADGEVLRPRNVIWCTGLRPDHSWIQLPVFTPDGSVDHRRGVVRNVPGLYFLGLSFQHSVASAALYGVDPDARYLIRRMTLTT